MKIEIYCYKQTWRKRLVSCVLLHSVYIPSWSRQKHFTTNGSAGLDRQGLRSLQIWFFSFGIFTAVCEHSVSVRIHACGVSVCICACGVSVYICVCMWCGVYMHMCMCMWCECVCINARGVSVCMWHEHVYVHMMKACVCTWKCP